MDTSEKTLLKATDLARRLNVAKSTIYMLAKDGQIPVVRIGKTGVRFDYNAVRHALQRDVRDRS